jgi:hypothetical protein
MTHVHGAVSRLVAKVGEARCDATNPFTEPFGTHHASDRCVYRLGHDGQHYIRGLAWSDTTKTPTGNP